MAVAPKFISIVYIFKKKAKLSKLNGLKSNSGHNFGMIFGNSNFMAPKLKDNFANTFCSLKLKQSRLKFICLHIMYPYKILNGCRPLYRVPESL